jgi:hypothetical protein
MNPRVSRSSALASKATGFPIAKIAAKMAIGYTLDEVPNDITKQTPASFEPTLDYVVVKVPRFAFEKFPAADPTLTTTMKSVGEAMSLGRNFTEALQKALRSMERKDASFHWDGPVPTPAVEVLLADRRPDRRADRRRPAGACVGGHRRAGARGDRYRPVVPRPDRAHQRGRRANFAGADRLHPDLLAPGQAARLLRPAARPAAGHAGGGRPGRPPRAGDPPGLQDRRHLRGRVRRPRPTTTRPTTRRPRCCPRERPASHHPRLRPNRIGQGVEFDYSCVHASFALRDAGLDTVMVNCNPETVSTDYDTSSRLYFEPLTLEDVLEVVEPSAAAGPIAGVIVQLGGQTPARAGPGAQGRGRADRRHLARGDPPRRGPRRLRPGARRGGPARAAARHGIQRRGGAREWRADRLPRAGAPLLRARRAGHGDRLRRRHPRHLCRAGHHRLARAPDPRRPVPRRRHRDRRRRPLRRRGDVPRRRHGAHRRGRHPLRRQRLRPAAEHPGQRRDRPGSRSPRSRWPRASASAA